MSLIATRVGLIHRMTTERDISTGDGGGGSTPDWQAHLSDEPCRAFTATTKQAVSAEQVVVIDDSRITVPLGTDVLETDRVLSVIDRAGVDVLSGPMRIQAIASYADHLEILVQQAR